MKKMLFCGILLAATTVTQAQKFFTKDGTIRFFSDAKVEKNRSHQQQSLHRTRCFKRRY